MPGDNILEELSARCGGSIYISVWGEETAFSRLKNALINGGVKDVKYCDKTLPVQLLNFEMGADYASFNGQTEGKVRAIVYGDLAQKQGAEEAALFCNCPSVFMDLNGEEIATFKEDGAALTAGTDTLLQALIQEFPLKRIDVNIPGWTQVMPQENSAISELLKIVTEKSANIHKMGEVKTLENMFEGAVYWNESVKIDADLKTGFVKITAYAKDGIFYKMLSEIAGDEIDGEYSLMRFVRASAQASRGYAKVKDALECASVNGYGIVQPSEDDIIYDSPAVVKQGGNVGIKLKASAPSYHIIRVDVSGEVNPIMGSAAQSESMVQGMMAGFERNPEEMWNTDLFGKTLKCMVQEGLSAKVSAITEDTRSKLRKAVNRMVNEGKGGAIVIIL